MAIDYPYFISDNYIEKNGDQCISEYEIYMVFFPATFTRTF